MKALTPLLISLTAALLFPARVSPQPVPAQPVPARPDTSAAKLPVDYVNPFIGTTAYGTTNPGALCPNGTMSVSPFNVMGSDLNLHDKDSLWWSTPYDHLNAWLTGLSHVNLSGVGCPDLGSLLLMPTTGPLDVDYREYGSPYCDETATPGYYSVRLTRYGITAEATATTRVGLTRFTFPGGEGHILLNLGEGLTNESGAMLRRTADNEFEGMKLLGTFCYCSQAVFPIYFVMRVNKILDAGDNAPETCDPDWKPLSGCWKRQRPMTGVEAEWDPDDGRYKLYPSYGREIAGDDTGAWLTFDTSPGDRIEVQIAISFTSIANARLNLAAETNGKDFDTVRAEARARWNDDLSRIIVQGGTDDQKTVFYTALYHTLIHPNILSDINGDYPEADGPRTLNIFTPTPGPASPRYTVFSLWDTCRNLHQLLTLVYPERQTAMVRTILGIYRETGRLPRWELYGRETYTMEGDPAIPVIADTWLKGLRDFDIDLAYQAMRRSAFTPGPANPIRPDNDDYLALGHIPLRAPNDNSVSHALEYYVADAALSRLASALGHTVDAEILRRRSLGYTRYYDPSVGTFRPLLPDGTFYSPFDPRLGADFEENPGFHEGCAWNYTFYVPHDPLGLITLMGGPKPFTDKLQKVFDDGLYDPANEPDIAYAHLFSRIPGEEWRTTREVRRLLDTRFRNAPDGIPGNDDAGTMSAWAVFNMIGLYPDCPGDPSYTLLAPVFDRITIRLDPRYAGRDSLVIETLRSDPPASSASTSTPASTPAHAPAPDCPRIRSVELGGRPISGRRVTHSDLIAAGTLRFILE